MLPFISCKRCSRRIFCFLYYIRTRIALECKLFRSAVEDLNVTFKVHERLSSHLAISIYKMSLHNSKDAYFSQETNDLWRQVNAKRYLQDDSFSQIFGLVRYMQYVVRNSNRKVDSSRCTLCFLQLRLKLILRIRRIYIKSRTISFSHIHRRILNLYARLCVLNIFFCKNICAKEK